MNRTDKVQILRDADIELFDEPSTNYDEFTDKELDSEIAVTLKMAVRNIRFLSNRVTELTGMNKY